MSYANINLEGRLVGAPEYKTGKEGKTYVTFTVAVNQHFGPQENASFFNCTGSEFVANRIRKGGLEKGQLIHIAGNLTLREYETQSGAKKMSADVGILDWHYVGSKNANAEKSPASPAVPAERPMATGSVRQIRIDDDDLPI